MPDLVDFATQTLSWLILLVHALLLLYAIRWALRRAGVAKTGEWPAILRPPAGFLLRIHADLQSHALELAFLIAITAMAGSLFFSQVAGWEPCELCWYQRIFMYPQAVMLAIAVLLKDRRIWPYTLALSLIGGTISVYHYAASTLLPASASGLCTAAGGPSCLFNYFTQFGYITLPFMALTASLSIALISWFWLRERKGE